MVFQSGMVQLASDCTNERLRRLMSWKIDVTREKGYEQYRHTLPQSMTNVLVRLSFHQIDETSMDSSQLGIAPSHAKPRKAYQAHNRTIAVTDQHSLVSSFYLLGLL